MTRVTFVFAALVALCSTPTARAAGEAGEQAPDFPPGLFLDGNRYSLKDLDGKAVVLFFYEKDCPRCREKIPERNQIVEQYRDKPVKFIAVAAGDSTAEAKAYVTETKLAMPVFVDNLSLMEARYGTKISLQNIWQFRLIGPDGKIVNYSMAPADIDRAIAKVQWKYKDGGWDPKLAGAVELLEWGRYADGLRTLKPHLKASKKDVAESAKKLYDAVRAEGEKWLTEADAAVAAEKSVDAYDLYTKVATAFAGDDLAKRTAAPLKKLAASQAVKDELAARQMYVQLCQGAARAQPADRPQVATFAATIAKKYPNSPTGLRAADVAKELTSTTGAAAK